MNLALVDTNVVSFFFKRDTRARLYLPHLAGKTLGISFMTYAEMERWSLEHGWGQTRYVRLLTYLDRFTFHGVTPNLCRQWALVRAHAKAQGRSLDTADAWIAATAVLHGCPLITHNRADFSFITGLTIISEAP